jgi:hypothetical protein
MLTHAAEIANVHAFEKLEENPSLDKHTFGLTKRRNSLIEGMATNFSARVVSKKTVQVTPWPIPQFT